MRSSVIIVNEKANWGGLPNARNRVWGPGSGRHKVRQVAAFLHQQGLSFSTCATQYPGHARELAATAAAQGTDTVIVIGGDGTVNEVVNGLLTAGRDPLPRVGIIPAGSSNDFSKSLGIPQHLREACRVIAQGQGQGGGRGTGGVALLLLGFLPGLLRRGGGPDGKGE